MTSFDILPLATPSDQELIALAQIGGDTNETMFWTRVFCF